MDMEFDARGAGGIPGQNMPADGAEMAMQIAIGPEEVKKFTSVLQKYKAGRANTERRIVASENWWKLRNSAEEQQSATMAQDGFKSVSGWLHNVIVSKHADGIEAFPEAILLPRESQDKQEAELLSDIIPCVLEQNQFEKTYSDVLWQKLKTGTGVYKVVWDATKLHGLGDISIERVSLLNVYWEPGVTDVQRSRYLFHTELWDKDELEQMYPALLKDKLKGQTFMSTKFLYDDHQDDENKITVIDVYYHKVVNGKKTLQYCKYVNDIVLFASENDPEMLHTGLYDHGKYPYVFDPLFPIEGSPCGYGYVDLCKNPQMEIDLLKTSFVKNAMVGSTPRYFARGDGAVNENEFLDLRKPIVHVNGNIDDSYLRQIDFKALDGTYVGLLDRNIQELRETSGNTETATGSAGSGVTAASAIAALQEASGKGSRDSTKASYRSFTQIVDFCIELIRQFYDMPRQFRIVGEYGMQKFVTYTNQGLKGQSQGSAFGQDLGMRMPVFDIKVDAQKKSAYTRISNNELAIQFFQMGFFNPNMAEQALICLELMDFDNKDEVMQKVSQNAMIHEKMLQYMRLALELAKVARPDMVAGLSNDIAVTLGGDPMAAPTGAAPQLMEGDNVEGVQQKEHALVEKSRQRSQAASQPGGEVTQ